MTVQQLHDRLAHLISAGKAGLKVIATSDATSISDVMQDHAKINDAVVVSAPRMSANGQPFWSDEIVILTYES